jgi:hypothetical protein
MVSVPDELKSVFDADFKDVVYLQTVHKVTYGVHFHESRIKSTDTDGILADMDQKYACERKVDEYHGPHGRGFVVHHFWTVDGVKYTKAINVGPEKWRSSEPHEVPAEELTG